MFLSKAISFSLSNSTTFWANRRFINCCFKKWKLTLSRNNLTPVLGNGGKAPNNSNKISKNYKIAPNFSVTDEPLRVYDTVQLKMLERAQLQCCISGQMLTWHFSQADVCYLSWLYMPWLSVLLSIDWIRETYPQNANSWMTAFTFKPAKLGYKTSQTYFFVKLSVLLFLLVLVCLKITSGQPGNSVPSDTDYTIMKNLYCKINMKHFD